MSVYDLAGLVDVLPIARTTLRGDDDSTVLAYLESPAHDPQDPVARPADDAENAEVDWWQHYGFASRPPSGAEALVIRAGQQVFGLASRALAALGVFGKLKEGDVALYSMGGNLIRLNANGSISVLVPQKNGKQMVVRLDPEGTIKGLVAPSYAFEFGKDGCVINAADKDVTISGKIVTISAQAFINNSPVIKLNAAAALPLLPTSQNPGVFAGV